ncbi:hypothetical protein D3C76_1388620 [compost metagenome]
MHGYPPFTPMLSQIREWFENVTLSAVDRKSLHIPGVHPLIEPFPAGYNLFIQGPFSRDPAMSMFVHD